MFIDIIKHITIYLKRKLFLSDSIYLLENSITLVEINKTIDEYKVFDHSIISSIFIFILRGLMISHSMINSLFIKIRIAVQDSVTIDKINRIFGRDFIMFRI